MTADDRFDCIVVGGGVAGLTAAYRLAKAGLGVVLIERGSTAGNKNMTGGRLYAHSLEKVMPGFAERAPIERRIVHERICMLTDDAQVAIDFHEGKEQSPQTASYSVLRSIFDAWLAEEAEAAGVEIISGIRVDELLIRDGVVCGVIAGDDELEAKVTILADGVNSLLAQKAGMRKEFSPSHLAVGIKELVSLPASVIEDRFQADSDTGTAVMYAGSITDGAFGGGFLYTNKESISLGIVVSLHDVVRGNRSTPEMMDYFRNHPSIAPLIRGGKLLEYSAHLLPEGGMAMMPPLYGDGVLVVGDAAGLCVNLGYMARGMDLAITSADIAADVVISAVEAEDFSKERLATYQEALKQSYVLSDLELYRNAPDFFSQTPRLFTEYPQMLADMMRGLFHVDGSASTRLSKKMLPLARKIGLLNILGDVRKGMKAL